MRLYLSDRESRQALTAGRVLIVRPMVPQPRPGLFGDGSVIGKHPDQLSDGVYQVWDSAHGVVALTKDGLPRLLECAPWRPGDVVVGREAWARVSNCPLDCEPGCEGCTHERTLYRASDSVEAERYVQSEDGDELKWNSSARMPDKRVRHWLRVVRVECRQVGGISVKEALETGAPVLKGMQINNGKEPIRRVRYDWEKRFGKRAPWPEGWAWFTWFESAT